MFRTSISFLALCFSASSVPAQLLPASADVLDAFTHSLVEARAVVLVPGSTPVQGRCSGILLVKCEDGWEEPISIVLSGVLQSEASDIVLVIRTRRSLNRIMEGDGKVDSEVMAFVGKKSGTPPSEGLFVYRGLPLPRSFKTVEELKSRLATLSAAPAKCVVRTDLRTLEFLLAPDNRELLLGGVAAVATFLAAFRRLKP